VVSPGYDNLTDNLRDIRCAVQNKAFRTSRETGPLLRIRLSRA
jgi:hypothetical protein